MEMTDRDSIVDSVSLGSAGTMSSHQSASSSSSASSEMEHPELMDTSFLHIKGKMDLLSHFNPMISAIVGIVVEPGKGPSRKSNNEAASTSNSSTSSSVTTLPKINGTNSNNNNKTRNKASPTLKDVEISKSKKLELEPSGPLGITPPPPLPGTKRQPRHVKPKVPSHRVKPGRIKLPPLPNSSRNKLPGLTVKPDFSNVKSTIPPLEPKPRKKPKMLLDRAEELTDTENRVYEVLQVAFVLTKDAEMLEAIRTEIEEELGYSIGDGEGKKKLAKDLAGVKSLSQLAAVFNVPEYEVHHYYLVLKGQLEREGGLAGLKQMLVAHRAVSVWLKKTDYPNLPLKQGNRKEVKEFFETLKAENEMKVLFDLQLPGLPLLMPSERLSKVITECKDQSSLATALQVEPADLENLRTKWSELAQPYRLYYRLAVVANELGFLQLNQELPMPHPKASSKQVQQIYDYLTAAVEAEWLGLTRYHREALEYQLEESMLDVECRMAFAEKLAKCSTIADLAKLMNASMEDMQECYDYLGNSLREYYDGMRGLKAMHQVTSRMSEFLATTDYPHLPLRNVNREYIVDFFRSLQSDISETYLLVFQSPVLPINETPEELADIMLRCRNAKELANKLRCKVADVHWVMRHGRSKFEEYTREFDLLIQGVLIAKQLGFNELAK